MKGSGTDRRTNCPITPCARCRYAAGFKRVYPSAPFSPWVCPIPRRTRPSPRPQPRFRDSPPLSCVLSLAALLLLSASRLAAQGVDVIRGRVDRPGWRADRERQRHRHLGDRRRQPHRAHRRERPLHHHLPRRRGRLLRRLRGARLRAEAVRDKRTADQEILVADVRLARAARHARRREGRRPTREQVDAQRRSADISGTEQRGRTPARVAADQLGDLDAMAASIPGVQLDPRRRRRSGGLLGARPRPPIRTARRSTACTFGGGNISARRERLDLARHVAVRRVARRLQRRAVQHAHAAAARTSSAAATSAELRRAAAAVDRPRRALARPAVHATSRSAALLSGPIETDKAFYNVSYQLGRRASDLQTLLNTDPLGLQTAGVSRRFGGAPARHPARGAACPPTAGGVPQQPAERPGLAVRQHRLRAAGVDAAGRRSTSSFNGNWNRADAGARLDHRASRAQRRPHELERRRAGAAHGVLRHRHAQRDDASA